MGFLKEHVHFLLFSTFFLLLPFFCAGEDPINTFCDNRGKERSQQMTYNIGRVVKYIIGNALAEGFSTYAEGDGDDRIYGLAQCRRDVSKNECVSCLVDAAEQIPDLCPDQVDARIWFDHCFVHHSNVDFIGKLDTYVALQGPDDLENVTEPERFTAELDKLLNDVKEQAIRPESKGLGKAQTNFTASQTLHVLFQCSEDLSPADCGMCMSPSKQTMLDFCLHKKACRVVYTSCYTRYAFEPF